MLHSEIPPYGHLGDAAVASLLQTLFFSRLAETAIHFLEKKTLVNTANLY